MLSYLVWNATVCVSPRKATIWLPKEQVHGKHIIYFIKFGPTILGKLGVLPNGKSRLEEAKKSPK